MIHYAKCYVIEVFKVKFSDYSGIVSILTLKYNVRDEHFFMDCIFNGNTSNWYTGFIFERFSIVLFQSIPKIKNIK